MFFGNGADVFRDYFFRVDDGADLEQIEGVCALTGIVEVDGKFYFNGASHFVLGYAQHPFQDFGQGKHLVSEDVGECDDFSPSFVKAVVKHLVMDVESGSNVVKRAVRSGFLYGYFQQVAPIVYLRYEVGIAQVECVEPGLRFA